MNRRRDGWLTLLVLIATIALGTSGGYARAAEPSIPPVLEPWRGWVLDRHPELKCPPRFDNGQVRPCVWMSTLNLDLGHEGGRFTIDVEVFSDTDVTLPGGADQWPRDVRSNGGPAIVTRLDDRPRIRLTPGRYSLNGAFDWTEMPDAISLPRQHGILRLTLEGAAIAQPLIDGERLWLGKAPGAASEVPNDSLTARVYRRLDDGVPMMLTTFVDLSVAGSHRIVTLGRAMPEGFETTAIKSNLPARLDANGQLKVQVEPGEWQVQLTGRALGVPTSFRATPETDNWPKEEIWGFNADRAFRVVNVEGATPIDLSQTNAPFKDLPAYVVTADNDLKLVEQFRGDPSPSPNDFSLARSMWLSFDGSSYTVRDTLNGKLALPTRLAASFVPGRMTVDDNPELITRLGDAKPGVELPSGTHTIVAVSEIPRRGLDTAVGWDTDVAALTGELQLPPGWRLLWTHGVDRAPTAWLPSWTLWDIFLVVISVVLALRLLGPTAAALVALTLVLVYQESEAPTLVWIVLLLLLAVLRIGRGRFGQFARLSYFVVFAFTVIAVLSFAIDNFRMAIYPQLENAGYTIYEQELPASAPSAPVPRQMLRKSADMAEELVVTAAESKPRRQFEANTQVQTGPGVPTWRWRERNVDLGRSGHCRATDRPGAVAAVADAQFACHRPGAAAVARGDLRWRNAAAGNAVAGLAEANDRAGRRCAANGGRARATGCARRHSESGHARRTRETADRAAGLSARVRRRGTRDGETEWRRVDRSVGHQRARARLRYRFPQPRRNGGRSTSATPTVPRWSRATRRDNCRSR